MTTASRGEPFGALEPGPIVAVHRPMGCCGTELCVDVNALALEGYDPVSYFSGGAPQRGWPDNALIWHGAVFHFRARCNQRLFLRDPRRYAPQYGGFCSLAMASGRVDTGDPTAFRVVDARLYLLVNGEGLAEWEQRVGHYVRLADERWALRLRRFA